MSTYYRQIMLCFCILILTLLSCGEDKNSSGPPSIEGWDLVWNDEFDGDGIDFTKWNHEVYAQVGWNSELQYNTDRPENSYVQDGKLIIRTLREEFTGPDGTCDFTSARLSTKNRGDWLYGRLDIRAKLPKGQGFLPAIRMLPTDSEYGDWPASGEISIMELQGHEPQTIYGTLQYGGSFPQNVRTRADYSLPEGQGDFSDDFHVFTLKWDPYAIRLFVDGDVYLSASNWYTNDEPYPAPFDKPFYVVLHVAVGGSWPGNPDETTQFPQTMEIDYVRVYQLEE